MKVAIVGFPQSGKTTLFSALTGQQAQGRGKQNLGVIKVPDARLDALADICQPKKLTHAEVSFVDIPGSQTPGQALDAATLNEMRPQDAFAAVIRGHAALGEPTPQKDLESLEGELCFADMAVIEKRLERLKKEGSKNTREIEILARCQAHLEKELPLRTLSLMEDEQQIISGFRFLSQKPLLAVLNVSEDAAASPIDAKIATYAKEHGFAAFPLAVSLEAEIAELSPEEQLEFLKGLGLEQSAKSTFIRAAYNLLGLMSFFTAGEDEVRAWTIRHKTPAVKAAGKIHSDIERGFIRAEVIAYEDFIKYKSEAKCREMGKFRLEGKEYEVKDGEIVHFRSNV
jgi:hypothetical protein